MPTTKSLLYENFYGFMLLLFMGKLSHLHRFNAYIWPQNSAEHFRIVTVRANQQNCMNTVLSGQTLFYAQWYHPFQYKLA